MKVAVTTRKSTARLVNTQVSIDLAQRTVLAVASSRPSPTTAQVTADTLVFRADSTLLRADAAA